MVARMPISPSLQGLSRAVTPSIGTQPWNATTDPLGVNIQNQGMQTTQAYDRSQAASDYGIVPPDQAMGQSIGQSVHQMGPLEDPQWAGFFQAVSDFLISLNCVGVNLENVCYRRNIADLFLHAVYADT